MGGQARARQTIRTSANTWIDAVMSGDEDTIKKAVYKTKASGEVRHQDKLSKASTAEALECRVAIKDLSMNTVLAIRTNLELAPINELQKRSKVIMKKHLPYLLGKRANLVKCSSAPFLPQRSKMSFDTTY